MVPAAAAVLGLVALGFAELTPPGLGAPLAFAEASAPVFVSPLGVRLEAPVHPFAREAPAPSPSRPAEGVLIIRSTPRGARVTVNGIGRGETPVTVRYLPPGPQRVRVVKDGYVSRERVVLLDGGTARVEMAMRRR